MIKFKNYSFYVYIAGRLKYVVASFADAIEILNNVSRETLS